MVTDRVKSFHTLAPWSLHKHLSDILSLNDRLMLCFMTEFQNMNARWFMYILHVYECVCIQDIQWFWQGLFIAYPCLFYLAIVAMGYATAMKNKCISLFVPVDVYTAICGWIPSGMSVFNEWLKQGRSCISSFSTSRRVPAPPAEYIGRSRTSRYSHFSTMDSEVIYRNIDWWCFYL